MADREIPMSERRRHVHKKVRSFLRSGMELQAVGVLLPLLITSERKKIKEALANLDHDQVPRRIEDVRRDVEALQAFRDGGGRVH
jgi:hypothetical protein